MYLSGQATIHPTPNEDDIDWWSKYYASVGRFEACGNFLTCGYSNMLVLDGELEDHEPFQRFVDFCHTFEFQRPKKMLANKNRFHLQSKIEDDSSLSRECALCCF